MVVGLLHPGEMGAAVGACPPSAALEVAQSIAACGFDGVYVDANAVSPARSREVEGVVGPGHYIDGSIVGGPPDAQEHPRLYLSGARAGPVADLFAGTWVDARVLDAPIGTASALKMAYAAWTKGSAAMLLAISELAGAEGVETALWAEWADSQPGLQDRLVAAERSATAKGWRWIGEMHEIADTFAADGLPEGFHRAAAEVFSATSERQGL